MSIQQGDVILVPQEKLPEGLKARKSLILAEGEGHHVHVLAPESPGDVEIFEGEDGTIWLSVKAPTPLVHKTVGGGNGEHGTALVLPKIYRMNPVHEWDPWANEARGVAD